MELGDLAQRITNLENDMMLVRDGSIVEHISEAIHWKATSVRLTGGTDYTVDGTWTDLDLTAHTSVNAKFVLLNLYIVREAGESLFVRKNGDTPSYVPYVVCQVAERWNVGFVICACDSGQIIEYSATDASDTMIDILGYIE